MLYISVIHLSLCYFCVCSDGLSVKVFAFKSIQLTSQHDRHLLYTRHVYRHLLSCFREWVPRFSYDETKGWGICSSVSKYTANVLTKMERKMDFSVDNTTSFGTQKLFTGSSTNYYKAQCNAGLHNKPGERENYCVSPITCSFPDITT